MTALAAAILAGTTVFVLAGALTGQFGRSYRRALDRAAAVAARGSASGRARRTHLLRRDSFARSASVASVLRRWEWAKTRAVLLDRANVPLKVSEWVLLLAGTFALLAVAGTAVSGLPPAGVLFGIAGVLGWELWLRARARARLNKFEQQLPWALDVMATSLRSGFGVMESVATVAREAEPPLAQEFRRLLEFSRMGGPFEEGLEAMTDRIGSADLRIVARALAVHRKVGGNLAAILESVARTMREREELRGHVRALTAQQRLGGLVVALLPLWIVGFFLVADPDFISPLWKEPVGRLLLAFAAGMELAAFIVMRRILAIEV